MTLSFPVLLRRLSTLVTLSLLVSSCKTAEKAPEAATEESTPSRLAQQDEEQAEKAPEQSLLKKGFGKKPCTLISKKDVSKLFSLPDSEVKEMSFGGICIYSWSNKVDGKEMRVSLHSPQVLKSEKIAQRYFTNATKNRSAEEVAAQMARVRKSLEKQGKLKSKSKKTAAKKVGSAVADKGQSWKDVEGVGQAARMNTRDGKLFVWERNLLFSVEAYHGPQAPELERKGIALSEIVALSRQNEDAWNQKTLSQREKAASDIAKKIITNLEN